MTSVNDWITAILNKRPVVENYQLLNLIYSFLSIGAFTSFWTEKCNPKCEYLLFVKKFL